MTGVEASARRRHRYVSVGPGPGSRDCMEGYSCCPPTGTPALMGRAGAPGLPHDSAGEHPRHQDGVTDPPIGSEERRYHRLPQAIRRRLKEKMTEPAPDCRRRGQDCAAGSIDNSGGQDDNIRTWAVGLEYPPALLRVFCVRGDAWPSRRTRGSAMASRKPDLARDDALGRIRRSRQPCAVTGFVGLGRFKRWTRTIPAPVRLSWRK